MTSEATRQTPPDFDALDPIFTVDPHREYARLRQQCPVARTETFGGYWLLTRYDDVRDAARNAEVFSSRDSIVIPDVGNPVPFLPIQLDPPEHAQYRKPLQSWFSVSRLLTLEDDIRQMVTERLDPIVAKGQADLCAELAGPIPPMVIALLLGLDRSDWKMFQQMAEQLITAAERDDSAANTEAMTWLLGYMWEQIAARRAEPRDDLLTYMTEMEIFDEPIADDQVMGLALFTLLAGHETSTGAIGAMLMYLARDPHSQQRLRADPQIIPRAVEEVLRYDPPVPGLARTVRQNVAVAGIELAAGDRVMLSWASANRDPGVFSAPDTLVIDRPNNNHMAFGNGIHRCLGANLARLEMRVILEEVLRRLPPFRITNEADVVVGGVLARGPRMLPISWY
jgi:cytochrome P450